MFVDDAAKIGSFFTKRKVFFPAPYTYLGAYSTNEFA